MKRERLQAVLRVRSLQERGARGELARRSTAHHQAVSAEQHTWERLERVADATTSTDGLVAMRAVRDAGLRAVESQHRITDETLADTVVARDEWTIAARRVEALDRLGTRLREADDAEAERQQILEIDDLVLARRGRQPGGELA